MLTEHGTAEFRKRIQRWRDLQQKIAFVPTMGNLHAGHIALVKRARELGQRVVASTRMAAHCTRADSTLMVV